MKKSIIALLLCLSLLLTGCGWPSGKYVSVKPHQEQRQTGQSKVASAGNYLELVRVLEDMIHDGVESGAVNIAAIIYIQVFLTLMVTEKTHYCSNRLEVGSFTSLCH